MNSAGPKMGEASEAHLKRDYGSCKTPEIHTPKDVSIRQMFSGMDAAEEFLLSLGIICAVLRGASRPLLALVFGQMTNSFVSVVTSIADGKQGDSVSQFALIYVYLGLGTLVVSIIQGITFEWTCETRVHKLRVKFLRSVLSRDMIWHDEQQTGTLTSQLTDDFERFREGIGHKFSMIPQNWSTVVSGLLISAFVSWELTILVLMITLIVFIMSYISARLGTTSEQREQERYGKASAVAEQALSALKTVISFGGEPSTIESYNKELEAGMSLAIKRIKTFASAEACRIFIMYISYGAILWFGCQLLLRHNILAGSIFTVLSAGMGSAQALGNCWPFYSAFRSAHASAIRIFSIIKTQPNENSAGVRPKPIIGHLQFKEVEFSYPSRTTVKVLKKFSLDISPGLCVAVVGESGAGKSTIVNLLLRFYDYKTGNIFLDGIDIRELDVNYLRQQIGTVCQEPVLFSGSIRDNISIGTSNATMEEVVQAAQLANAHDFIVSLPDQYDTVVGERGSQLSGGQKQRIAIARALISHPRILILDEATSALDYESEAVVQDALKQGRMGRTTLIIAHRLATVRDADIIVFLHEGVVVESGQHEELMMMKGYYYNHAQAQTTTAVPTELKVGDESLPHHFQRLSSSQESSGESSSTEIAQAERSGRVMLRLLGVINSDWIYLVVGFIAAGIFALVTPAFAFIYGELLPVFSLPPTALKEAAVSWSVAVGLLGVVNGLSTWFMLTFLAIANNLLAKSLRVRALTAVIAKPVAWFDKEHNSPIRLLTRLSRDVGIIMAACSDRIIFMLVSLIMIISSVILAIIFGWQLACTLCAAFPFIVIGGRIETLVLRDGQKGDALVIETASKLATEAIQHIRTIKCLVAENRCIQMYETMLQPVLRRALKQAVVFGISYGTTESMLLFFYAITFELAGYFINNGTMNITNVYRTFFAIALCIGPVTRFLSLVPDYSKVQHAGDQILRMINLTSSINPFSTEGLRPELKGMITFKNVRFLYPSRPDNPVLKGLSFEVAPGKTLALVGTSGNGKSTVMSLILRFYDVTGGAVMIDGWDVRDLNIRFLRSHLGLVNQEPQVFDMTIRENIAYGLVGSNVPDIEIVQAARIANAHNFIMEFPQGYGTRVGEGGVGLSGGQKQRIAIARAMIRKPKILLLDEATSAMDPITEEVVTQAMTNAREGRTCILVAHRLSTVEKADAIAVINDGQISELGSHAELMGHRGAYFKLVQQSQGDVNYSFGFTEVGGTPMQSPIIFIIPPFRCVEGKYWHRKVTVLQGRKVQGQTDSDENAVKLLLDMIHDSMANFRCSRIFCESVVKKMVLLELSLEEDKKGVKFKILTDMEGTKVIASGNISKGVPASSLIQMGNLEFVLSGKFLLRSKLDMGQPLKESTSCKIVLGLEDQAADALISLWKSFEEAGAVDSLDTMADLVAVRVDDDTVKNFAGKDAEKDLKCMNVKKTNDK